MIGDGECTWWPDVWLGVSITPCCTEHDVSDIDLRAALDLGVCVYRMMEAADYAGAGLLLGAIMCGGTGAWAIIRRLRAGA